MAKSDLFSLRQKRSEVGTPGYLSAHAFVNALLVQLLSK